MSYLRSRTSADPTRFAVDSPEKIDLIPVMDQKTFESLLYRGESESLDFKVDQYTFEKATHEEKAKLLKDLLAFANAWRETDAYILIGVNEGQSGKATVLGITKHLDDHALHEFANAKTQRPIEFNYERLAFDGKDCGIIRIPVQRRPIYLLKDYGGLLKEVVYIRRGSSTGNAAPDEVAEMGKERAPAGAPAFEIEAKPQVRRGRQGFEVGVVGFLFNRGVATAYDVAMEFWSKNRSSASTMKRISVDHLHPMESRRIMRWIAWRFSGNVKSNQELLSRYAGPDLTVQIKFFARDQSPTFINVDFSIAEIQSGTTKTFRPSLSERT